jgi:hypothetical protein
MSRDKIQELDNMLAGIFREPPLISTNAEPLPSPFSDPPNNEEPPVHSPVVEDPADAGNAVRQAEQARLLLAGLGRDTAIRLRWAMRDIRGKRMKMSPVSENDLAALMDLGFAEVYEGTPRLTDLGVLVLD